MQRRELKIIVTLLWPNNNYLQDSSVYHLSAWKYQATCTQFDPLMKSSLNTRRKKWSQIQLQMWHQWSSYWLSQKEKLWRVSSRSLLIWNIRRQQFQDSLGRTLYGEARVGIRWPILLPDGQYLYQLISLRSTVLSHKAQSATELCTPHDHSRQGSRS